MPRIQPMTMPTMLCVERAIIVGERWRLLYRKGAVRRISHGTLGEVSHVRARARWAMGQSAQTGVAALGGLAFLRLHLPYLTSAHFFVSLGHVSVSLFLVVCVRM